MKLQSLVLGGFFLAACASHADFSPLAGSGDGGGTLDGAPDTGVAEDGAAPDSALEAGSPCTGASPRFAADVSPILKQGCGGENCHSGLAAGAWPYAALIDVHPSRDPCAASGFLVVQGHPEKSYLVNKLSGTGMCAGTRQMPIGNPLPAADQQLIVDWICSGAQND